MRYCQKWMGRCCTAGRDTWFEASVPGNIQYDFGVANGFADVQFSDNYKQYIPLENDHWEYRAELCYEAARGERVYFVSGGIDYRYDVLLGDKLLYSYEGMFRSVELDLTEHLTGNGDVLTVHIYPHPKRKDAREGTRDEADESCKPPVCYGWDWNPRLLISGMWQDAYIETRSDAYIGNCEVLADLNADMTKGTVTFSFECAVPCETALYDADGNEVYRGTDRRIAVDSPELWWCNGQGTPYLYRWSVSNGREERSGRIGFRKLRLVRNAGARGPSEFPKTRYEAPATIELNGRRIMAKGSNWVNPELFWGHITPDRYDELLILARDAHMNILRMWGGASVCKESFYELCDKYGILVWQEFMLACNLYPNTPEYLSVLESEASAIILKLRAHPSIAFWCGGNELFNAWSGMDDQSYPLRLLNKLCYELDRKRPYLPTSPLFGMAHGGYRFYAENQGGEVMNEFRRSNNTAYTEFGVPSISSVDILKKIIPEDEMFPPSPTDAWVAHHGFKAWTPTTWVCPETLESYFGKPESIEQMVEQSNWLQCEGYAAAFEEMRKQWPHCSMMINWCYNEPWYTAANNNLISYPAAPKPAYEYVKSAMRPTLFSARIGKFSWGAGESFEAEIWLLNDSPESVRGSVHAALIIGDRRIELLDWTAETGANSSLQGPTVRCVLPFEEADRLTFVLESDTDTSSSYTLQYKPKKKSPPRKVLND